MTHLALYRAWRPRQFDEVVEQKHAVFALRQSVISKKIAHAYLFSGTRGTGKTTLAKIFSRAINCLQPQKGNPCNQCEICKGILDGSLLDVVEMDAASNNSVDNIRRICDEVVFMPSQAQYKVYIIDEAHMLSTGAFNALLKTLEEPPSHAVFILATTEPHRIPATILSRCQRYDFRRIPVEGMTTRLAEIADSDQISISADALKTIAMLADGAMRDAISLLDQARMRYSEAISRDDVLSLAGIVQDTFMIQMAQAIHEGNPAGLLDLIEQLIMDGRDLTHFVTDLAQFYRNLLVCRVSRQPESLVRASSESLEHMTEMSRQGSPSEWVAMIQGLSSLLSDIRWSSDARTTLEIGLIRLMDEQVVLKSAGLTKPLNDKQTQAHSDSKKTNQKTVQASDKPSASQPSRSRIDEEGENQAGQSQFADDEKTGTEAGNSTREAQAAKADQPDADPVQSMTDPQPSDTVHGLAEPDADPEQSMTDPQPSDALHGLAEPDAAPVQSMTDPQPSETGPTGSEKEQDSAQLKQSATQALHGDERSDQPDDRLDVKKLWHFVSDMLQEKGYMTLYLFSRPARVSMDGDKLLLFFSQTDQLHYIEIHKPESISVLRQFASQAAGRNIEVVTELEDAQINREMSPKKPAEPPWIEKVTDTANELGIPIKMED